MYMNLTPNKHKRIFFNTTTMESLGFIGPPPKILGPPPLLSFYSGLPNAQISQKQDKRNIYVIMKIMCPPGCGNSFTWAHDVRLVGTWCVVDEHKALTYC